MKTVCTWTERLQFASTTGGAPVKMDAKKPLGDETAPTPKELLLAALCGCSAMDVVSLMRKYKQPLREFSIEAEAKVRAAHPAIFSEINLVYHFRGDLDLQRVTEAVRLSETQFCSVSAMLSRAVPIRYSVEINGAVVESGRANFEAYWP